MPKASKKQPQLPVVPQPQLPQPPFVVQPGQELMFQPQSKQSEFAQELYSGAATVGRVTSTISLVIGNIIGFALIIGGVYAIFRKPVLSSNYANQNEVQKDVDSQKKAFRTLGIFLLIIGLIIVGVSWAYWYVIRKSKVVAAASGAGTVLDWVVPDPGLGTFGSPTPFSVFDDGW